MEEYRQLTIWDVIWDAIRGAFVYLIYAIIDGVAYLVKQFVYNTAYPQ